MAFTLVNKLLLVYPFPCVQLTNCDCVDINPNNIFLSNIHGPAPVVKVGDLGTVSV